MFQVTFSLLTIWLKKLHGVSDQNVCRKDEIWRQIVYNFVLNITYMIRNSIKKKCIWQTRFTVALTFHDLYSDE